MGSLAKPDAVSDQEPESDSSSNPGLDRFTQPKPQVSQEHQAKLAELSKYLDRCAADLKEIRTELSPSQPGLKSNESLQRSYELLADLCVEADGWGFDSLCEVASGLQHVLWAYRNNAWNLHSAEVVEEALKLLSTILGQCEEDFRRRLAVSHLLDSFDRFSEIA